MSDDERTLWCGNLHDKITEDLLYELFLQVLKFKYFSLLFIFTFSLKIVLFLEENLSCSTSFLQICESKFET